MLSFKTIPQNCFRVVKLIFQSVKFSCNTVLTTMFFSMKFCLRKIKLHVSDKKRFILFSCLMLKGDIVDFFTVFKYYNEHICSIKTEAL